MNAHYKFLEYLGRYDTSKNCQKNRGQDDTF